MDPPDPLEWEEFTAANEILVSWATITVATGYTVEYKTTVRYFQIILLILLKLDLVYTVMTSTTATQALIPCAAQGNSQFKPLFIPIHSNFFFF